MDIEIKLLTTTATAPTRGTSGSAAYDLSADSLRTIYMPGGALDRRDQAIEIHTGIAIHIDDPAVVGLIYPRSSLYKKHRLALVNTVGVIDSDYQGELILICALQELSTCPAKGERVAQIIFTPRFDVEFIPVSVFTTESDRGTGGFGSTGK